MNIDKTGRTIRLPWQKRAALLPEKLQTGESSHKSFLDFLPLTIKNHVVAMIGEFVGTFLFLFFAFGGTNAVNTAPKDGTPADLNANPAKLFYIALCFGFSLVVNAWIFFRISGGLFNPAVSDTIAGILWRPFLIMKQISLGMMLIGGVPYLRGGLVIISQLLGGIAAAAVVKALTAGPLNIRVSIAGGINVAQALFMEMFLTAGLVFTVFMLAAEKHKATFIAPIGIGLALFIGELFGVYYTGGALNPARAFGPCVVAHSFYHYHWIYWVGPALGSLVAAGFYALIKALDYETVNPDQDEETDDENDKSNKTKKIKNDSKTKDNDQTQDEQSNSTVVADPPKSTHNTHEHVDQDEHYRDGTSHNAFGNERKSSYPMAYLATTTPTPQNQNFENFNRDGNSYAARYTINNSTYDTYGQGPSIETGDHRPVQ